MGSLQDFSELPSQQHVYNMSPIQPENTPGTAIDSPMEKEAPAESVKELTKMFGCSILLTIVIMILFSSLFLDVKLLDMNISRFITRNNLNIVSTYNDQPKVDGPAEEAGAQRSRAWEFLGQRGDSFGMLTCFFSGTAFILIAYSLYLQRQDLTATRKQLGHAIATHGDTVKSLNQEISLAMEQHKKNIESQMREQTSRYWSPEFYTFRRRAFIFINFLFDDFKKQDSKNEFTENLDLFMDWYVEADSDAITKLNSRIEELTKKRGISSYVTSERHPDWDICLSLVINYWCLLSHRLKAAEEGSYERTSYRGLLGNQWDWWGPPLTRLVQIYSQERNYNPIILNVSKPDEIPTQGKRHVIVARINDVLHFRIFEGSGKVSVDTSETKLEPLDEEKRGNLQELKYLLKEPESSSNPDIRKKISLLVKSIVGYTPPSRNLGPAIWEYEIPAFAKLDEELKGDKDI